MDQHIILNFEGIDGATSWTEEAHALVPELTQNCEIDTAQYYSGSSSLLMFTDDESGWAILQYKNISDIYTEAFSIRALFRCSNFSVSDKFTLKIGDINGAGYPDLEFAAMKVGSAILPTIYANDYANTAIGGWSDDGSNPISEDAWHLAEIIISGRDIALKVDNTLLATLTAAIDDPMKGSVEFITTCYHEDADGAKTWLDSVVLESGIEGVDIVQIPSASMTMVGHGPYRHSLIPVADMTFFTLAPDFGSLFASIPAGVLTLLARNPSPTWTIPNNKLATAQIIYKCILTGSEDGLTDLTLPMKSFQARLRDGDPSYLSCVIPDSTTYATLVAARTNGEIVIYSGYKFDDGTEQTEEIIRANYDSLQINRGANSDSLTISGYKTITSSSPKEWTVTGISFYGQTAEGKRRIRANFDQFIRCGDTCIYGTGGNDYFIVGSITCWVTAKPAGYFMEASEA